MTSGSPLRVFHATDFSTASERAYAHALRLAIADRAELTVLHVDTPSKEPKWEDFPLAAEVLERWGMDPDDAPPVERVEVDDVDVVRGVLLYLADHPADLLVLSTRGREGVTNWWEGCVSEPVARVTKTMTLFVNESARGIVSTDDGAIKLDKILVPVAPEPDPALALEAARAMRKAFGHPDAKIQLCHVGDPLNAPIVGDGEAPLSLREGDVTEGIVSLAEEIEADLIVMATQGRDGFLDAFRGSTTERVLRAAPCPVLGVPVKPA